jgi:2-polyprenyl-6-hydroxyphenyl methylase/3-demethylubiquinone-9 3-methyltransferase
MSPTVNLDPDEVARFDRDAAGWWNPDGPYRTLHVINPVRLRYVEGAAGLSGKRVLDVGCGGGLLCEAMAARGAVVTGIDAGAEAIAIAERHRDERGLSIAYRVATIEQFAELRPQPFDAITCMELLEHVPDPAAVVTAAAQLLRPGGHFIASTINRTTRAWLTAIVGAEHLLGLLPRGTHEYARFIRPSELASWVRAAGFEVVDVSGMRYLPWIDRAALSADAGVNYLMHARLKA